MTAWVPCERNSRGSARLFSSRFSLGMLPVLTLGAAAATKSHTRGSGNQSGLYRSDSLHSEWRTSQRTIIEETLPQPSHFKIAGASRTPEKPASQRRTSVEGDYTKDAQSSGLDCGSLTRPDAIRKRTHEARKATVVAHGFYPYLLTINLVVLEKGGAESSENSQVNSRTE